MKSSWNSFDCVKISNKLSRAREYFDDESKVWFLNDVYYTYHIIFKKYTNPLFHWCNFLKFKYVSPIISFILCSILQL